MKKNKAMSAPGTIGAIVLVLVIVFLYLSFTGKSFGSLFSGVDNVQDSFIKETLDKCREKYNPAIHTKESGDFDEDGLPDFCDNCPLVSNIAEPDKDGDLFPLGCCGNDGNFNFMKKNKDGKLVYKEPRTWCGDKKETDELTQKPRHPKYSITWS